MKRTPANTTRHRRTGKGCHAATRVDAVFIRPASRRATGSARGQTWTSPGRTDPGGVLGAQHIGKPATGPETWAGTCFLVQLTPSKGVFRSDERRSCMAREGSPLGRRRIQERPAYRDSLGNGALKTQKPEAATTGSGVRPRQTGLNMYGRSIGRRIPRVKYGGCRG